MRTKTWRMASCHLKNSYRPKRLTCQLINPLCFSRTALHFIRKGPGILGRNIFGLRPNGHFRPGSSQLIEPAVVLRTGATGGLGSFLLSELLKSPVVQRVYAFNRPSSLKSIAERQKFAFKTKGL
ncbi:hypothetical protein L210DRAFT_3580694 [Boletus edulis BED1]|uniref:Thioester reductase (TE) domain-containing protein n=1 Tax=Boletus edulis BED1 TaxID=1328754 RepID=A0AAD4BBW6_BOLED|nr:hypothetical protein L210DRAFT_3580694 [Boletus edulis BED1]